MIKLTGISIRHRLIAALVLMLLPLLLLGVGSFLSIKRSFGGVDEIVGGKVNELVPIQYLRYVVTQSSLPVRRFSLTATPEDRELYFDLESEVDRAFQEILKLPAPRPGERQHLQECLEQWRNARTLARDIVAEIGVEEPGGEENRLKLLNEYLGSISETLAQETSLILEETSENTRKARQEVHHLAFLVGGLLVLSFLMASLAAFLLTRSILGPLEDLREATRTIGEGDLSHRVSSAYPSELRELSGAFNRMTEKLEALTVRDELTGLFNRREMNRRMEEEIERARRYSHPLSLLLMDIDHFKSVNDRYGHQAGDAVLRQIGLRIRDALRPTDWVARYGGEEIAAVLPETGIEDARLVAERIRAGLEGQPFLLDNGSRIAVTLSVGVGTFPDHAEFSYGLVAAADAAVYDAKDRGRNCVRVFEQTLT